MKRIIISVLFLSALNIFAQSTEPAIKLVQGNVDSTYSAKHFLRGVALPNTQIEVNGVNFPVYWTGAFAAETNLKDGQNTIFLKNGEFTDSLKVFLKKRAEPQATTEAIIEKVELFPSAKELWLKPGDELKIKVKALPGAELIWLKNQKLHELPLSETNGLAGIYQGIYKVKDGDDIFEKPITIHLKSKEGKDKKEIASIISIVPENYIVRTKKDAYLNYGLGSDRLGGSKINFLDEGIKLRVVGKVGNMLKVEMAKNQAAWIPESLTEVAPAGVFVPEALSGSWSVRAQGKYDVVSIGLSEKLPYRIWDETDPSQIVIDIFGAASNTNWITQLQGLKAVKSVSMEQWQDDVLRIYIKLKNEQSWGYSAYYTGNSLNIKLKHKPESLELKNLLIGLDAGHGDPWNGAQTTPGYKEQYLNHDMVQTLKKLLQEKGAKVIESRPDSVDVNMSTRKQIFKDAEVDIMLSVHCNAGGSPFVGGTSTYYRNKQSEKLSEDILAYLLELPVKNFGKIGSFNFSLSAPTEYPTTLVETLFLSSPEDESKIMEPEFRQQMMQKVVIGLEKFLKEAK